jgi:hypothetical protein
MTLTNESPPKFLYLDEKQWSPRFEETVYTVRVESFQRLDEAPDNLPADIGGNTHHPCFYYKVVLRRARLTKTLWRRFSHFQWLYNNVRVDPPTTNQDDSPSNEPLKLPPGTCWPFQSAKLGENRVELLSTFLDDMLSRQGYASHPSVVTFLEL